MEVVPSSYHIFVLAFSWTILGVVDCQVEAEGVDIDDASQT